MAQQGLQDKSIEVHVKSIISDLKSGLDSVQTNYSNIDRSIERFTIGVERRLTSVDVPTEVDNVQDQFDGSIERNTTNVVEFKSLNPTNTAELNKIGKLTEYLPGSTVPTSLKKMVENYKPNTDTLDVVDKEGVTDKVVTGTERLYPRLLVNESMENSQGINRVRNNGVPCMSMSTSNPADFTDNVYVNLFDTRITRSNAEMSNKSILDLNMRDSDNAIERPSTYISIDRVNKVYALDFTLSLVTREGALSAFNKNGVFDSLYSNIVGTKTINFVGSIILTDEGDHFTTKVIVENNNDTIIQEQLPEFNFRVAFDEKCIYLFLDTITQPRILMVDGKESIYLKDLVELAQNGGYPTMSGDSMLQLTNTYGPKGLGLITPGTEAAVLSILNGVDILEDDEDRMVLLPNFTVNLGINNTSLTSAHTMIIGQVYDKPEILDMSYNCFEVKAEQGYRYTTKGVTFVDGTLVDPSRKALTTTYYNSIFNKVTGKIEPKSSVSELIAGVSDFIKSKSFNGRKVLYDITAYVKSVPDGDMNVISNSLPDYTIHEVGEYVAGEDRFSHKSYIYFKDMNDGISIDGMTSRVLNGILTSKGIPVVQVVDNGPTPEIVTIPNRVPTIDVTETDPHRFTVPLTILSKYGDMYISENPKSLIRVDINIHPNSNYDASIVTVGHITIPDNNIFGELANAEYPSDPLSVQALVKESYTKIV